MARADVRGRRRNLSAEAGRRGDEQSGFRSGEVRKRIEYAMMLREKGISIREENPEDRRTIGRVVERAFRAEERSDHREHLLVERLRGSEAFVPRLSLVAECDGIVVGYALMSEVRIESDGNYEISLALAPVAVLPEFQRQGIGSALIREAHRRAADSGIRATCMPGASTDMKGTS